MKVTSKEQFDAIQYTSIEVIRDFADSCNIPTVASKVMMVGGKLISPDEWLVVEYDDCQTICHVLSDEKFHEQYISADAFNDAVKYANGVNSLVFELEEQVDELNNKMFTQEEKDFILKALTHMTSTSDDIHTRVEQNARIARIKQQILDKLCHT